MEQTQHILGSGLRLSDYFACGLEGATVTLQDIRWFESGFGSVLAKFVGSDPRLHLRLQVATHTWGLPKIGDPNIVP